MRFKDLKRQSKPRRKRLAVRSKKANRKNQRKPTTKRRLKKRRKLNLILMPALRKMDLHSSISMTCLKIASSVAESLESIEI